MNNKKIILKILIFISILSININIVSSYDYIEENTFNVSELPINGSYYYYFNPIINTTLYFNQVETDNMMILDFVSNYTFLDNITQYKFEVNWNITDDAILNNKTIISSINITNSVNNNTKSMAFKTNLIKIDPPVIQITSTDTLDIEDGIYSKTISVDKLPYENKFSFNLGGVPNSTFTFDNCTNFLICPQGVYSFNSTGRKIIDIEYKIPYTTIGHHNSSFNVIGNNISKTIITNFEIIMPNLFTTNIKYNLSEECYDDILSFTTQLKCEEEREKALQSYRREVILGYSQYVSNIDSSNICNQSIKTEYIIGDSISKEILDINNEILRENQNLREDNEYLKLEILEYKSKLNNKQLEVNQTILSKDSEIIDIKDQELQKKLQIIRIDEKEKIQYKTDTSFSIKLIVFIFMILSIILLLFDYWQQVSYGKMPIIKFSIILSIIIFFFISWISLILFT